MGRAAKKPIVQSAYLVPGLPHVLLQAEKSPGWARLRAAYDAAAAEVARADADLILYLSTQWLSVIGWMFQADPAPEWVHVDPNWHEMGSIPYRFRVDAEFAKAYAREVGKLGVNAAPVAYRGFPIDTGTIVAQKLLDPENRLPSAMVSVNMYAEREETAAVGRAAAATLGALGKTAVVVLVSSLSSRFEVSEIDPAKDRISSAKDHEWNLKIVELLGEGRIEDVDQCAREFAREANADLGFKGIWWLNGLLGGSNAFSGRVFGYEPIWGTGAAVIGFVPRSPVPAARPASRAIVVEAAPEPVGPYPHARQEGEWLFVSGIGPRRRGESAIPGTRLDAHGRVVGHDIEIQTRACIENIRAILEAAGGSLADIVDVQVFLVHMDRDFARFDQVYDEYFGGSRPTRTTVGVTGLPTPIAVELKVVARLPAAP